jgi:dTDP-4-amino-4,6-dideoxygalactose transaminase
VANGTDAIELILRAIGLRPDDEVVVPTNSFAATAEAVVRAGARVAFADCDATTLLMSGETLTAALTPRTRAVIPVHLYGQLAPMDEIGAVAAARGITVVEDAAQAHGAEQHGRTPGTIGIAASTSFYPGKNLGAYGDGGAVLTQDADLADRVRVIGDHGTRSKYEHVMLGCNSRLDALQAVVLDAKLRRLPAWNAAREVAAASYDDLLAGVEGVRRPARVAGNVHVWHLYVVRVPAAARSKVLEELDAAGIEAGIHYPIPIHRQPAFAGGHIPAGGLWNAELAADEILSLPMHPHLTRADQELVVAAVRRGLTA